MISRVSKKNKFKAKLHHTWSIFLLSLAIVIVLAAITLTLVRESTPLLANHHQNIQSWLSKRLKHPLEVGSLSAGWRGFEPIIKIHDVTIEDNQHQPLIHVDSFSIGFNLLKTLWSGHLKIGLIALSGGKLRIVQLANGDTEIYANSTTPIATLSRYHQGHGGLVKNLFEINKIYLSNTHVQWQRKDGRRIDFQNVRLEINNSKDSHHMWGIATLKQPSEGALAFVANFSGNIVNKETINGNVYIHGGGLDLDQWIPIKKISTLEINNGFVNGKAWANITAGKITSVQTDFDASAIQIENKQTKETFNINNLSANLYWQKQLQGWFISADKIFWSHNSELKPKQFYFNWYNSVKNPSFEAYLSQLPISFLKHIAMVSNNEKLKAYVGRYDPNGFLNNLYVHYDNKNNYAASFSLNNLALSENLKNLNLKNLETMVYIFPNMGSITLSSKHFAFDDEQLEKQLVNLKPFTDQIYWYKHNQQLTISWPQIHISNQDVDVSGSLEAEVPLNSPRQSVINLSLNTSPFKLSQIKNYLPKEVSEHKHLVSFLKDAFKKGSAAVNLKLDGPLAEFPYDKPNQQGDFSLAAILHNVNLLYKPGWPMIMGLNGSMNIHDNKLSILGKSAELYHTQLNDIYGEIPNIFAKSEPKILINGDVHGTLQRTEQFIKNTPLNRTLGQKLRDLNFQGPMNLHLNLELPLKPHTFKTQASGSLSMNNALVTMPHLGLKLTQVNGTLKFGHRDLIAKGIKGFFNQEPILIDINTLDSETEEAKTQINFWSEITADTLKHKFPNKYLNTLTGLTSFHAVLDLYNHEKNAENRLAITSQLKGLGIQLPAPFKLAAQQPEYFNAELDFDRKKPMFLKAQLGSEVHFVGEMRADTKGYHFYSGDLHFGSTQAVMQQTPGLLIDGDLPYLNWQQWRPYILTNSKEAGKGNVRLVNLNVQEINFYNYIFVRTQLQLTKQQQQWRIFANGPAISGEIYLPTASHDTLKASLQRLYLNLQTTVKKQTQDNKHFEPQSLPNLDVSVNDFRFGSNVFGQFNLSTHKTNIGMDIEKVSSGTERYDFNATGYWDNIKGKELAGLTGNLDALSISSLLQKFNVPNKFDAKNLRTSFNIYWPNSIFDPTFKNLSGTIKLATDSGVISNIGNKANNELATGQLLTFLSLQSLQKRIFLNFNDLNSKGFHFERMAGDFRITNGNAWTTDAQIDGIVASIALDGKIGFAHKSFNLFTTVTPHVTSSLPIIATLAGGPIIGAAAYVVNKIVSPSVNQMAARYFKITGSWSKPKIKAVQLPKPASKGPDRFKDF